MVRFATLAIAILLFCALDGSAFARKGFYVGGGYSTTTADGDIDGTEQLVNTAGTRQASIGKLDRGTGLNLDVGYNFTSYFGLELFASSTLHTAKSVNEAENTDAFGSGALAGVRLSAPLGQVMDVYARVGMASGGITYRKYGHEGTTTAGVFTQTDDKDFNIAGTGSGYGVGFVTYIGKHFGVGLSQTVLSIKFNAGAVGSDSSSRLPKDRNETLSTTSLTFVAHFGGGA